MAHLLIVDDEKPFAEMLQAFFVSRGHTAEVGFDGQMALRLAKARPPNLLIMDYQMPMTHGGTAVEYLRKIDKLKSVPIIILSGAPEAEVRRTFAGYPNLYYLKKPCALADLNEAAATALHLKKS